jgi:hypothetical protein
MPLFFLVYMRAGIAGVLGLEKKTTLKQKSAGKEQKYEPYSFHFTFCDGACTQKQSKWGSGRATWQTLKKPVFCNVLSFYFFC